MGIVSRYVLAELLKIFLIALAAMTGFLIIIGIVREAANQGLGPEQIVRLVPYILPDALRFTLPGTLLFTACMVYGRMSGSNEVMAIKAMGISPMVILWPVLALAVVLSLVAVWLNDVAVSWGKAGIRRVVIEAVESVAYGMLRTQRSYATNRFSITVKAVRDRTLISPVITFQANPDSPPVMFRAEEAELRSDRTENALTIIFRNFTVDYGGNVRMQNPGTFEQPIPLDAASRARSDAELSPSDLPLTAIGDRLENQKKSIEILEQEMAATAAYQIVTGDFDALTSPEWKHKRETLAYIQSGLFRLQTEPWRRWANGFSCLCFVLVGAPMAIRLRNSDVLTTFFICFLPILLVYYPLLTYGVDGAKRGALPPFSVWLGNVILVAWGAWVLRRVLRY
ncbi:MAG: YjgP/YjgQ family permease [Pirellulales bacterium]|nr:YjgP/YjgQ family permease [Pirellulales bacterium]